LIAQISNETLYGPDLPRGEPSKSSAPAFEGARGYFVGLCGAGGAFLLRLAFDELWEDRLAYAWFFLAVLVVARYAGTGPQIFTIVAGLLLGNWFFLHPRHSFEIAAAVDQINTAIYCGVGGLVLLMSGRARRLVSQELAARDRIAGILECTTDAVCTINENWVVTYFNRRASELTQLEVAKVLGRDHHEIWPEMAGTRFEREYRRVMSRRETVHFEERHPVTQQWMEVHACPYGDGMAIFFRDVTGRKRAEAARAQLAAIVESSDDAIVGKSIDGLIVSWNAAAEQLYGYTPAEAIGRSFEMLFPRERSCELAALLEKVRRGERVNHLETGQRTKTGGTVEVSMTVSPVQTKDGENVGVSITARDITERKRQEAERERLIQQLQTALAEVKTLSGLLPICASCKKIRDDKGYWNQIESYIGARSRARFSHGICPDCMGHLYPGITLPGEMQS
jgi:PAS domain S-box-containing protein